MRVLVAGARGLLGAAIVREFADVDLCLFGHRELDITSDSSIAAAFASVHPDVVINCAAYNDVDRAEREPEAVLRTNALGVLSLARAAREAGATFVHYSTDFVFDGEIDRPYVEDDPPNPRGVYAVSKLLGEWFAGEAPVHYVLRVESLFGGPQARSSVDKILQNIQAGREVRAFADRTVSPSYVEDVVRAASTLLERRNASGVYHCVNSGWTTWSGLARELAAIAGKPDAVITDVMMSDAGLTAPRPKFAALDNAKLTATGVDMPTWQDALRRYVSTLA